MHHRGTASNYYEGIDVSLECASVCVVDGAGKIVGESKVASEPEALIGWFRELGLSVTRIGLEPGPLVALALCGAAPGGARGRIVGDPPGNAPFAQRAQDDAGQDRPQRRPR